ncbi:MAG: HPr family phosphocarrier protein [Clostridia bacterium]|nr:HPr family phosphocarrier protein [Clostridia bacterium]
MRVVDIVLNGPEHVSALVNITNRYPYTIQLRQGRYVVDGKSILGVCSLQQSKPITLEVYSDHCDTLIEDLQPLIC